MRDALLVLLLTLSLSSNADAGFIITVAAITPLQPNTPNQSVDVFLKSDSLADPALRGMNFQAYLGNSHAAVLNKQHGVFQGPAAPLTHPGVQLTGGGYFWDLGSGSTAGGEGPIVGAEAVAQVNVNFNSGSQLVGVGNTVKIATLTIDTSGLAAATYAISLGDPYAVTGSPTQLIASDASNIDEGIGLTLANGSFSIAAVPEPATLGIVGLAIVGAAGFRRRGSKSTT